MSPVRYVCPTCKATVTVGVPLRFAPVCYAPHPAGKRRRCHRDMRAETPVTS